MPETLHRHDLSDRHWELLEPHLPGRAGVWGGVARDNRQFINAVFWILRTGAPWRDLPASYGGWKNTHRRFCRWRDKGIWESLLEQCIDEPDFEWIAHFSDRGRLFQSDRGRRFSVIVDAPGCAQAMGFNVSQSSTIRLKRLSRSGR